MQELFVSVAAAVSLAWALLIALTSLVGLVAVFVEAGLIAIKMMVDSKDEG